MLLPTSLENLPPYDQAQVNKRFLTELDRLLQAGAFASYREWAKSVGVPESHINGIASNRYNCNIKLLYNTLRFYPGMDLGFVLFGAAVFARPEPAAAPVRKRGARIKYPAPNA